jgi:NAD+ kinase
MKIKKLGLVANVNKREIAEVISGVLALVPSDVEVCGPEDTVKLAPPGRVAPTATFADCSVVIALGGDGTLLRAARLVAEDGIPLLGIKIRSLGFLTEDDPERAVSDLFDGRYAVQDRMRLEVVCQAGGREQRRLSALNDAVVHGVGVSRVIHLRTTIDGATLGEYLADGVIVSTPTGSTAYSLAAGGPIVNPASVEAFIITPLCPHSLSVRPLVVSSRETFSVELVEGGHETLLTLDGQQSYPIGVGERLLFRKHSRATRLIVTEGYRFYDLVRRKLKWGGVLRQDH